MTDECDLLNCIILIAFFSVSGFAILCVVIIAAIRHRARFRFLVKEGKLTSPNGVIINGTTYVISINLTGHGIEHWVIGEHIEDISSLIEWTDYGLIFRGGKRICPALSKKMIEQLKSSNQLKEYYFR